MYIIMNGNKRKIEISELPSLPAKQENKVVHYIDICSPKTGKWYSFYSDGKEIYQLEIVRNDNKKLREEPHSDEDIIVDVTGGAIFL